MHFHIITLFKEAFESYLGSSILKRAIQDKKISVSFYNPRDYTTDPNHRVDQKPYGGGPGMVIEALPVIKAIEKAKVKIKNQKVKIILFSPQGKMFNNAMAKKISSGAKHVILICGRYEGIDHRVKKIFKPDQISIGEYILTGGELPAMIVIDCVSRQIKGVLGDFNSLEENRVSTDEVYTRPESFKYKSKNYSVPKVLLGGHHAKIEEWKKSRKNCG